MLKILLENNVYAIIIIGQKWMLVVLNTHLSSNIVRILNIGWIFTGALDLFDSWYVHL